jgi:hypothetical protein
VLAKHVLAASPGKTLVCLLDFVKRREQSILEQYEAEFSASQRNHHEAEIENLSQHRVESPAPSPNCCFCTCATRLSLPGSITAIYGGERARRLST